VDVSKDFSDKIWERKLEKGLPYKLIDNAEFSNEASGHDPGRHPIRRTQAATLRRSALSEMNHCSTTRWNACKCSAS